MADVLGRALKLSFSTNGSSYTDLTGVKEISMSFARGEIDVTDCDSAGWEEALTGNAKCTLSGTLNYDEADAQQMALFTSIAAGSQVWLRVRPRGTLATYKEYIIKGQLTSLEESQAQDGAAELSFEFGSTGSVTIQAQT